MVHDSAVQQAVRPSIKLHLPTALTSTYYLMILNVPTLPSLFTDLLVELKREREKEGSSLGIKMSHIGILGSYLACHSKLLVTSVVTIKHKRLLLWFLNF